MKTLLIVGLGGCIGSITRYLLSVWVLHYTSPWKFPANTFAVNILGCLIAGLLIGFAEKRGLFAEELHLFLFVGLLGGFTTFSAFGVETVNLLRRGDAWIAALYILLSVLGGVAALWLGIRAFSLVLPEH